MSVKETNNENATRGNVYTIHMPQIHTSEYIEHINQQQQQWEKML